MFEPEFSKYSWAPELAAAAARGPDDARRFARRVRDQLSDEAADRIGEEFVQLMSDEPDDMIASLTAAAIPFAGPKTIARMGALLRSSATDWKIERGLQILQDNPSPESAIQLLLCARGGVAVQTMERAASMFRFSRMLVSKIATVVRADAPAEDVEQYFALALERAMLEGQRYTASDLSDALGGPTSSVLQRVLWAHYEGRRVREVFMVDPEDAGLVNMDWEPVTLESAASIGVVHPTEIDGDQRQHWGGAFADSEIVGLFAQLDRGHEPSADFPKLTIGREVPTADLLRFLHGEGWEHVQGSRAFEVRIRGSSLRLDARYVNGDEHRLEELALVRPRLDRDSREDDIIYNEARTATVRLLARFAPHLL